MPKGPTNSLVNSGLNCVKRILERAADHLQVDLQASMSAGDMHARRAFGDLSRACRLSAGP
jgi:hypothetical protein